MMSAADRATSVALSTLMPTSATCSAGGVVDAVAHVAHDVSGLAQRSDHLELLVRIDASEDRGFGRARDQRGGGHPAHLVAGQDAIDLQSNQSGDMAGNEIVCAGDDLEGDPLVRQRNDRFVDVRLGRIAEEDDPLERSGHARVGGIGKSDGHGAVGAAAVDLAASRSTSRSSRSSRPSRSKLERWQSSCRSARRRRRVRQTRSTRPPQHPAGHEPETVGGRAVDKLRKPIVLGLVDRSAVWSSRTVLDAATTASGAPFVTSRGGSLPRWTTTLSILRLKSYWQLGQFAIVGQVGGLGGARKDGCVERVLEARLEVAVEVGQLEGGDASPASSLSIPTALTSSSLPWVRVPVLSVQRTVTLPSSGWPAAA